MYFSLLFWTALFSALNLTTRLMFERSDDVHCLTCRN